ncbi:MAG: transcriptional regulator NrdR [Verrucomicrobiota bacterium]|nr:transcriptional regulator NrdR [Verrucomicrobiota bacterium]
MKCPKCNCEEDKVIDTRTSREGAAIRRRRECLDCQYRFTTYEEVVLRPELSVIKNDGTREEFSLSKIRRGVDMACWKRPIHQEEIEKIVKNVSTKISATYVDEIASSKIGAIVIEELRTMDKIAYIRFASVYRSFADVEEFAKEINAMLVKDAED